MTQKIRKIIIIAVIALFCIVVVANCITVVNAGHTGVVVTLGKVNEGVLQ